MGFLDKLLGRGKQVADRAMEESKGLADKAGDKLDEMRGHSHDEGDHTHDHDHEHPEEESPAPPA